MKLSLLMQILCILAAGAVAGVSTLNAQQIPADVGLRLQTEPKPDTSAVKPIVESVLPDYYDPDDGTTLSELLELANRANGELIAARMEVDKAKARYNQAALRPNPTIELEQTSGAIVGNSGDRSTTIGASMPIEIYDRRQARLNAARIEIDVREADIRNRERLLASAVLATYAEALGALREIEIAEKLLELDLQTTRFVQIRVNEGETAPLELNLLQAEIERLRSKTIIAEGRLKSTFTKLKLLAGIPFDQPLRINEQLETATLPTLPATDEAMIDLALKTRPDLSLLKLEETAAAAGLRVVKANAKPTLSAYARYTQGVTGVTLPGGNFPQTDRALSFGVTIGLPVFNKSEGAIAEADIALRQTRERISYSERTVTAEVIAANQRLRAASNAVANLRTAALPRTVQNTEVFRRVYALGEIRITELIAEQRRLIDVNRDLTDALIETYRALAELHMAIGAGILQTTGK